MPELFESRPGAFSHPIGLQRKGTTEIAEYAEENQKEAWKDGKVEHKKGG
jgi:hypothetical protein